MHTTHSSVIAGGPNGLSSGEEPHGVDLSLVTFEPHHTLPGATVPDTRSAITTLMEQRGKRQRKNLYTCLKMTCINPITTGTVYVTRKTCTVPYFLWCNVYLTYCSGKHSEWILWIQSQPVCLEMCRQRCRRAKAKQTSQLYTPRTALYFQGKRRAALGGIRTHHTLLSRRAL